MQTLKRIAGVAIVILLITVSIGQARPRGDALEIKTTEGKTLHALTLDEMAELTDSSATAIIGSFTLAEVNDDAKSDRVSLGRVSRREKDVLSNSYLPGTISVWLGKAPITFVREKHVWSGSGMRTEFVISDSRVIRNLHLTRDVCISARGKYLVSIKVSLPKQTPDELAGSPIRLRYEPAGPRSNRWETLVRTPQGEVVPLTSDAPFIEWELTGEKRRSCECLFGVGWIPDSPTYVTPTTKPAELSFGAIIEKSQSVRPASLTTVLKNVTSITSLQARVRRVLTGMFPGWDCPEPWLNRLWAAYIQGFVMVRMGEESVQGYECPLNDPKPLRWVYDLRWSTPLMVRNVIYLAFREATLPNVSLLASAEAAYQACRPDPHLHAKFLERTKAQATPVVSQPEYPIRNDAELLAWCRSFYVKGDFNRVIQLVPCDHGRKLQACVPVGVIDMVVRTVVGLQAEGSDRVHIAPAAWASRWRYFAIDNLPYRGHNLAVVWQSPESSRRYEYVDVGFSVFVDGKLARHSAKLEPVIIELK